MSLITDLGVDGNGIYQPKLKNRWRINFLGLAGDPDPLRVNAVTFDRPKLEFAEVAIHRYNSTAYVAGKHAFQPMNAAFEDDVGGLVGTTIQQQISLQQQIIGNSSSPRLPAAIGGAIYKFAIHADMLDGNDTPLETWIYEGCWIMNYDPETADYSVSEALRINLTIRFDQARQIINGIVVNATGGAGS